MSVVREAKTSDPSGPDSPHPPAPGPGAADAPNPRVISGRVIRTAGVSLRVQSRTLAVTTLLLAALVLVVGITLTTGDFPLTVPEVLQALTGQGSGAADFVVNTLRMPRILTAVFVGAALAVSGAILQSLTRNSLGSPDIIGFTNGSAVGALVVIILLHGSMTQIAFGALVGGLATALAVHLLMIGRGLQGFRLVVIGVGVSALLLAVNSYLITRASFQEALEAQAWLIGSLGNRLWVHANAIGIALAVLLPPALFLSRRLAMVEMGDNTAMGLGVNVGRTRTALLVISVSLAAFATAVTGPIWFIALAAPQVVRRLTRSSAPALLPSALMGAVLLVVSDLVVQRAFAPALLPVGTATGAVGGLYLIWLLISESRKSRA
ncbi:FecCD family ABC transporter permease [Streptomyces sp. NPDC054861]